ncbi:MAG: ferritin family protein [Halanaerobiales bacterium]
MLNNSFNAVEVLEMAKDIEERGYDFYQSQAKISNDDELKQLFLKLAEDEQDHYQRFNNLIKNVDKVTREDAEYVYEPEVSAYLEALVEFSIFPDSSEMNIENVKDALRMAIYAEKDSILFYQEMLKNNQGETADVVKQLIKEEKKHLLELIRYSDEIVV